MSSGMPAPDDMPTYTEVNTMLAHCHAYTHPKSNFISIQHRQQSSLNTPVVALQTPGISGLSAYPSLGSFGAQDFSMSSSDVMSLTTWNQQNLGSVHHTRYYAKLFVNFHH